MKYSLWQNNFKVKKKILQLWNGHLAGLNFNSCNCDAQVLVTGQSLIAQDALYSTSVDPVAYTCGLQLPKLG